MLERVLENEPLVRLVVQHPRDEVKHEALFVSVSPLRAVPPVLGKGPAVLGRVPGRGLAPVPGKSPARLAEEVCLGPADGGGRKLSEDSGHHRQVLQIVVGLEQGVALNHQLGLQQNKTISPAS